MVHHGVVGVYGVHAMHSDAMLVVAHLLRHSGSGVVTLFSTTTPATSYCCTISGIA